MASLRDWCFPCRPPNHHYRLTLSVEGLGVRVVGVQPATLGAGGLAHAAELLKMLERAAGLKSSVWGIKWGGGDGGQRLGLSARSNGWLPPGWRKRQEIELADVHEYGIVHVAVNMTHTLNRQSHSQTALEKMLGEQLRQLLRRIPWLSGVQVETNPAPFDRAFDLMAHFQVPRGPRIELWVECKLDPRPSQFPYVTLEREFEARTVKRVKVPVFAAPYVSPRMAEICESHGWSWFDLAGNCRITVPDLFHLEQGGKPAVWQRPRPIANLGTPEAGRVVRALLLPEHGGMRWTQRQMAGHFGKLPERKPKQPALPEPSLGLVNKVVRHLRGEAFIEELPDGGFRLRDPLKLLFAWRDAYRFDRHQRRGYFTLSQGKKLWEALARLGSQTGGFAVYAAFSAAEIPGAARAAGKDLAVCPRSGGGQVRTSGRGQAGGIGGEFGGPDTR